MSAVVDMKTGLSGLPPRGIQGLTPSERDRLVVSTVRINGELQILSRYGDRKWRFLGRTTNQNKSSRSIDFDGIPSAFREPLKAVLWRYQRVGRDGHPPPSDARILGLFKTLRPFLRFLADNNLVSLSQANQFVCGNYAHSMRARRRRDGKALLPQSLRILFTDVEALWELSQHTDDPMPGHPWPESRADLLAGHVGRARPSSATTPVIPDDVLSALFKAATSLIERGPTLLDWRDAIERIAGNQGRKRYLKSVGWIHGLQQFQSELCQLRTACYIVVGTLCGCRNHELAFIRADACYPTQHDGETYWWMRSRSTKTGAGATEWMVPEAAVKALRLMDRWALPHQKALREEIAARQALDASDPEIADAERHLDAVFVGVTLQQDDCVRTLSNGTMNIALNVFARKHGVAWKLATHQFRRTFAVYAAKSRFGDLRYLKEHFKHWTMDMTLLYAINTAQEEDLFLEIGEELDAIQQGVLDSCLDPAEPLSGGAGRRIVAFRTKHPVYVVEKRGDLVRNLAPTTRLRATGHGWCTADNDDCIGRTQFDRTRCVDCNNGIIARCHAAVYRAQREQSEELLKLSDLGPGGLAAVRRTIERCDHVQCDLDGPVVAGVAA